MTLPRSSYALSGAALGIGLLLASPGIALASWTSAGSGSAAVKASRLPYVTGLSTDVTGSQVRLTWSAAEVMTGHPVSGYRVFRYAAGTGTALAAGTGCSGVRATATCTESGVPDGTWQYAVQAVQGDWLGGVSARVAAVVHTAVTPGTVSLTFPVAGQTYGPGNWTAIAGTATPSSGSTLTKVEVSVQRAGGGFWNGSGFSSGTEQLTAVTGDLAAWRLPFAVDRFPAVSPAGYVVRVVAGDSSGRTVSTSHAFTVDRQGPSAVDVQANNVSGSAGRIDGGDRIVLTFSEAIDPASIRTAGWNTGALPVTIQNAGSGGGNDVLAFYDAGNNRITALGTIDMGQAGYLKGTDAPTAKVTVNGSTVTVTIDAAVGSIGNNGNRASRAMTWTPGAVADLLGNTAAETRGAGESGTPVDVDF